MGRHRKVRSRIRAFVAVTVTAAAVMVSGTLYALAQSAPAPVHLVPVHLSAPVLTAPLEPSQPAAAPKVYVVRSGDTLTSIAGAQCHDAQKWSSLASANHLGNGNTLTIGQKVTIAC